MHREDNSSNHSMFSYEEEGKRDGGIRQMIGQSSENNSIYGNEDEIRREEQIRKIRKEAADMLSRLDFGQHSHRKVLSTAFRKLNKAIEKTETDRFKYYLSEDHGMLDRLVESAYFFRPYEVLDPQFKYNSNNFYDAFRGNRRCRQPLIKVDGVALDWGEDLKKVIVREKDFKFEAEAEAGSQIWITNKQNSHPLLVQVQQNSNQFRRVYYQQCSQVFSPPCMLCLVAHKQNFKIQSRVLELEVRPSQQIEASRGQMVDLKLAVRPGQYYPFDESASLGASSSNYGMMPE